MWGVLWGFVVVCALGGGCRVGMFIVVVVYDVI